MRYSTLFGRSTHGSIAHADAVSHDLLERAGYIRQHAAGIYTYLHLGLRSLRRIERIVRDEMDRTGAQEILMPMVHDAGVWRQTGRYDAIDATLARFSDRHGRDARARHDARRDRRRAGSRRAPVVPATGHGGLSDSDQISRRGSSRAAVCCGRASSS